MSLPEQMTALARDAKTAALQMPRLNTGEKNACLFAMADALEGNASIIHEANAKDMKTGRSMD